MSTIERKINDATKEFDEVSSKLNHYKIYNTEEKINEKIQSILKSQGLEGIVNYRVDKNVVTIKKKIGRGKISPNSKYEEIEKIIYNLEYSINKEAKEKYNKLCGYFILATNKPAKELSIKGGLIAYKQEWKVEDIFNRLKGSLQVVPIYLQLPQHIESMMYLLMTCAQIFTLMDREAKNTLAERNEVMAGLFPNKITTKSPKSEDMMDKMGNMSLTYIINNGKVRVYVSELKPLQKRILDITHVTLKWYDTKYIEEQLNQKGILNDWLKNTLILFGLKIKVET